MMQAEERMMFLSWRVARYTSGEAVRSRLTRQRQTTLEAPPQSLIRLTLRKQRGSKT